MRWKNNKILPIIIVFVLTGLSAPAFATQFYTVTNLGTGTVYDINNKGQVIGENGLWDIKNDWQDLGFTPTAINKKGQIVGENYLWSNGKTIDLGFDAMDLNDVGQVVGSVGPRREEHAVIWENGKLTDIHSDDPFGLDWYPQGYSEHSSAVGINNTGQIVGSTSISSEDVRVIWEEQNGNWTVYQDIITIWEEFFPITINDSGQVLLGISYAPPMIWEKSGSTRINIPWVNDLNNLGQVVGRVEATDPYYAFLWEDGLAIDLNDIILPDSGWHLLEATALNELGQIVGTGIFNGEAQSFLLNPVPEPSTMFLLGTGLIGLAGWGRRKFKKNTN